MARKKRSIRAFIPAAVGAVLIAALVLLYETLRKYHLRDIIDHLHSYSTTAIITAMALTVLNYAVLSLYDVLALRYVNEKLPYQKTFFASFLSYVFSYNIGLSIFGSSAIRLRFYSTWGIDGDKIARIITFCVATFWIGLAAAGGVTLLASPIFPSELSAFKLPSIVIGVLLSSAVIAYLVACARGKTKISFRGFSAALPSGRIAVAQVLVAALDWCIAAYILYMLLPAGRPPFLRFLSIYIMAQLAAATSHVPGGVGVLESVLVLSLSSYLQPGELFGSILVYRSVYYLFPLCAAIVTFTAREAWTARRKASDIAKAAGPLIPALLAIAVFISGAVLLFSSAAPVMRDRLLLLYSLFPLALLETSHFAASLIGLALLFVADALRRRVDAAYFISLALLASGAVFSLLKGFAWEEATVLLLVILLLIPSRKLFYRRSVLLSPQAGAWWFIAVGTVLASGAWLGFFAFKHVQYSHELWWQFELSHDAPRFMRAGLGISIFAAIASLKILLGNRPRLPKETLPACEQDIRRILDLSDSSSANLAYLGDKYFHFGAGRESFIMYALSGRTCVVLGDPIGNKAEFADLLWDFYELVRQQGVRIVWYEISASHLPLFVELGLKVLKIGEEAIVDLPEFSLKGNRGARLRPACNKMEKDGYSFSVIPAEETRNRMTEFRAVSDQWLALKKAKEKGFSLGFFDEEYLCRFPCAVVSKGDAVVAFANLWTSGSKAEVSVDLMRHTADAPNGAMEFLFIRMIEWAKENGYQSFNLGMAPFSGLEARDAAPFWNKAVSLIFRTGEGLYNFQGLRAFKSKFQPRWYPRYIASSGALPVVSADIALLVSKGKRIAAGETID